MKHKHAELIKQWAEDVSLVVEVQMNDGSWRESSLPVWWDERFEYRVAKPAPNKIKFHAYSIGHRLVWVKEGEVISPSWVRIPSEDKEITLP